MRVHPWHYLPIYLQETPDPSSPHGGPCSNAPTTDGVSDYQNKVIASFLFLISCSIPFPFLVLLVSGGHCILAVAEAPGCFKRLGQTRDDSPGEALDKVARWMALHKHGGVPAHLSGGAAIELLARQGNPPERLKQDLFLDIMTKR